MIVGLSLFYCISHEILWKNLDLDKYELNESIKDKFLSELDNNIIIKLKSYLDRNSLQSRVNEN